MPPRVLCLLSNKVMKRKLCFCWYHITALLAFIVLNFLAEERCGNPWWAILQTNGGVGYCMTRILNEELREDVGGETDTARERARERGGERERERERERENERQWIRLPLREIIAPQILRPKYQRAHQEVGDLTHLRDSGLRRSRQEHGAIMRAIGTKRLLCPVFCSFASYFNLFLSIPLSHCLPFLSLTPIMNCIQYVVLGLRGLHFHIDGFFGELENWMLLSWFFFSLFLFLSPPSDGGGRHWGELHPNDPIEAFYLKPRRCIYQSSTLMNYVRGWETTPV